MEKRFTVFPEMDGASLGPLDLHKYHLPTLSPHEVYCSSSITSGNFGLRMRDVAKYFEGEAFETKKQQILRLNGILSNNWAAALLRLNMVDQNSVITMPHHLGVFKDWGELQYMTYWLMRMVRMNILNASKFYTEISEGRVLNNEVFGNYAASRDLRRVEYGKLLDHFSRYCCNDEGKVKSIIMFPGYQNSLGCATEMQAGFIAGIPVYELLVDTNYQGPIEGVRMNSMRWDYLKSIGSKLPYVKGDGTHGLLLRKISAF